MKRTYTKSIPDAPVPEVIYDSKGQAFLTADLLEQAKKSRSQYFNIRNNNIMGKGRIWPKFTDEEKQQLINSTIEEIQARYPYRTRQQIKQLIYNCRQQLKARNVYRIDSA